MTKQELLRNQADALDWIEQGKQVQLLIFDEWEDFKKDSNFWPGQLNVTDSTIWRIKPEVREFQPGILRDWLTVDDSGAFSQDYVYIATLVNVLPVRPVSATNSFKSRLVYATRERAEAARKAMGWAE